MYILTKHLRYDNNGNNVINNTVYQICIWKFETANSIRQTYYKLVRHVCIFTVAEWLMHSPATLGLGVTGSCRFTSFSDISEINFSNRYKSPAQRDLKWSVWHYMKNNVSRQNKCLLSEACLQDHYTNAIIIIIKQRLPAPSTFLLLKCHL